MEKSVLIATGFVLISCLFMPAVLGAVQSSQSISVYGTIGHTPAPVFETSFEDAAKSTEGFEHFVFPSYPQYPTTTNGFVYGAAQGESWIETGFAHTGTKCAGFRRSLDSERIEWNVWSLDQWVGQEAFVSEWMFLPAGFDTPEGWDCLAVIFAHGGTGLPYLELHVCKYATITGSKFGAYLGYRDINGNYSQKSFIILDELPLGRWFPVQWHVIKSATNGLVEVWLNSQYPNPPTMTFTGVTNGPQPYWYITPAKCYGDKVNAAGHTLWIDDLKIYTLPTST